MRAGEDVAFLQWALPRLHLRWEGFRRVRGQVCKRVTRRIREWASPTRRRRAVSSTPSGRRSWPPSIFRKR